MGFFKRLLRLEPGQSALLSAHIATTEDHQYFVSFSIHRPELNPSEYIRLVLHYYAKILFNFDPADEQMAWSAKILKEAMGTLLAHGIRKDAHIFRIIDVDDVACMIPSHPKDSPLELVATLSYVSDTRRHIASIIPTSSSAQHMVFSVFALIHTTLHKMNKEQIDIMQRALLLMNTLYDGGQSYADMNNLVAVPEQAYLSAVTDTSLKPHA